MSAADGPTADWLLCPGCDRLVYLARLRRNLDVCPDCDRHLRVDVPTRLTQLLDPGSAAALDFPVRENDPLSFVDVLPYPERVRRAKQRTGLAEAVLCARGTIEGNPVVVAAMDFRFLGGSLGTAVGELITLAAETALRERTPLLVVTASGGARMQEGALSLMQMAKTSQAFGELDKAGILTLSLITDPTYGGVAASFATLSDVIVIEPGARMGFAGPRVVAQTIGESLPPGFQTAKHLLAHGMVDLICHRTSLRETFGRLLSIGSRRPRTGAAADQRPVDAVVRDPGLLAEGDAWQAVRRARSLTRPTTRDYLRMVLDEFEELRGDRVSGDCPALIGGLGRLGDVALVAIGHQKGHTAAELVANNYGMATPAGYRMAARLVRLAAKLGLPVVSFVDTPGAYPGVEAEEQGQAVAIAELLRLMAGLPTPVVAVITGEGGSGGALALAVANRVLMCEHAVYSVISPEGCAAILWNDPAAAPTAAAALRLNAANLLRLGVVDGVVREPDGGSEADPPRAAELLRAALVAELGDLVPLNPPQLVVKRHKRFRAIGADVFSEEGSR